MGPVTLAQVEDQMRTIVQHLYQLIVQMYDHQGDITDQASKREIKTLIHNLLTLSRSAPNLHVDIPQDIIGYIQEGRNPDIYTREFVEYTMKNNQLLKGKAEAFASFRDILAKEIAGAVPELRPEVKTVVERTGGSFDVEEN